MKNILVPYDFSKYADYALNFAMEIAEKTGADIKLFHVIEHPVRGTFNTSLALGTQGVEDDIFTVELVESTRKRLDAISSERSNLPISLNTEIRIGRTFESIAEQVSENNVDLIVMGTKGSGGLNELLVGSNAEKVVRFSKCPVITVPEETSLKEIKNIVFATNFEEDQDYIIQELKKFQQVFEAKINLVWINTFQVNQNEELTQEKLQKTAESNGLENFEIFTHKAMKPGEGIVHFTKQKEMDMIAMATHGHRGLLHLLIGSIAEDVVNHSPKPVWTLSTKSKE